MAPGSELVLDYLTAYTSGDVEKATSLVSEDFSFRGPTEETVGKEAFSAIVAHVAPFARGFRLLRQSADGEDVCTLYEFDVERPSGATSVLVSEWNAISEEKVTSSLMVFDTAPFQAPVATGP